MSIHAISGKPGGGKSLFGMKALVNELRTTDRYVVTNLAVKLGELASYLHKLYGQSFDLNQRLTILDEEEVRKFWLYRGNGLVLPDVEQNDFSSANAANIWKQPSAEWIDGFCKRGGRGVCYILDELHLFFNAREWAKTGKAAIYYLSQHRKAGDDVIWITQHIENVDKQFRSLTQDFTYVRNFSKEKFASHFRSLPWFGYKVFQSPVTSLTVNAVPSETGRFLLDAKGLAACYDTAKGVGFAGAVAADTKAPKKGLPFFMVIPAGIAVCIVAWFVIYGGLRGIMAYVKHTPQRVMGGSVHTNTVSTAGTLPHFVPPGVLPQTNVIPREKSVKPAEPSRDSDDEIVMSGYAYVNKVWHVVLSDGRTLLSTDPEFELLTERGVKYGGHYYHRALRVNARVAHNSLPGASETNQVQAPPQPVETPSPVVQPDLNSWAGRSVNVHWSDGTTTHHKITDSGAPQQ